MRGDKGSDGVGAGDGPRNPYQLPGQDWDSSDDDPPRASDPEPSGISMSKAGHAAYPVGGRSTRMGPRQIWLVIFGPFMVVLLVVLSFAGVQYSRLPEDTGHASSSSPPPEPVSTVPPEVEGWKAVTSDRYGLTYDVPSSWHILPSTTLIGWDGVNGGRPAMMSSAAVFREDTCKDGDDEHDRGHTGFNQYVEGGTGQVAEHAANKWAVNAYSVEGDPAPTITLSAPETVKVGRAKAVHIRADIVVKSTGPCASPSAIVHTVAVPGTGPGKTTVFVLLSDQGVADAAPKAEIKKILGSLRPS